MSSSRPNADLFTSTIIGAAEAAAGQPATGTIIAPTVDREGSSAAVAYSFDGVTIIWCAPALADRLAPVADDDPIDIATFVGRCAEIGGTYVATGRHRVLEGPPTRTEAGPDRLRWLDPSTDADLALLQRFVDSSTEHDLDEAELYMDELDEHIVVSVDDRGEITSYASGRPFIMAGDFDDIAVITHPDHRGRRLGGFVVAEYCRVRQDLGRKMYYSCDVENLGSNRVADSLGFEIVCTVAASNFAD